MHLYGGLRRWRHLWVILFEHHAFQGLGFLYDLRIDLSLSWCFWICSLLIRIFRTLLLSHVELKSSIWLQLLVLIEFFLGQLMSECRQLASLSEIWLRCQILNCFEILLWVHRFKLMSLQLALNIALRIFWGSDIGLLYDSILALLRLVDSSTLSACCLSWRFDLDNARSW